MQAFWAELSLPAFKRALERCPASNSNNNVFTVLELGCATGGNSVPMLKEILRARSEWVHVYQDDLPDNKWSDCFSVAEQWMDLSRTSHCVIGRSFYTRGLVPPGSCDFVFSFTALHWCRKIQPWPRLGQTVQHYLNATEVESTESLRQVLRSTIESLKENGLMFWKIPGMSLDAVGKVKRSYMCVSNGCFFPCWVPNSVSN